MNKLDKFRELMKENGYDYYIIPSSDPHQSEYVAEYYKGRQFISGFTGSAGTLLVGLDKAKLWTDGRYFIQAESELANTGIDLMKERTINYPSLKEWIEDNVSKGDILGFDGRCISANDYKYYMEVASKKGFDIKLDLDLLESIWEDRPALSKDRVFIHDIKYSGKSVEGKIEEVRQRMKKLNVKNHIITTLDDIAWLFNIRGKDIDYNPVAMAYAIITDKKAILFIDAAKLTETVIVELKAQDVKIRDYSLIEKYVSELEGAVLIDLDKVNAKIYSLIEKNISIITGRNITTDLKAIKNSVEISNIENSQIRDGVAMVKFIKWLKENVGKKQITEISASNKLEELRSQGDNFKGLSFNTIAGYKDHAAMMHYSATEENQYELKQEGMFLVDSGGQYLDGTTDITRTFILGPITEEEKTDFTLVVKGHIALSKAIFLRGVCGCNLDILARQPLWERGIDYKCGTGHGVGFFLNVHEGPQGIRKELNSVPLELGMILTNEPGVYKSNKHGIRIENTLLVTKAMESEEMGEFYRFKTVSYCPIDLGGIEPSLLSLEEKNWLNEYHDVVYKKLSPYLDQSERVFLENETRKI